MKDFKQGDSVMVMEEGREVTGRVESIQLNPVTKIDVRLHDPGNMRHGLIVAYKPEDVELADSDELDSDFIKLSKDDLEKYFDRTAKAQSSMSDRISELESRVTALETKKTNKKS